MIINNNSASMMTLGELNKNISKGGKQLKKLALGERITGAGDDASGYSISERMRVRIRALDQDEQNVQNGQALLNVAEGAIQSQIELMKTIKQKVIDADNDTNTDVDRATIQKEINHAYQQIEDIAQETNYNGVRLLVGDHVEETVRSWVLKSNSSLLEGSDAMNMINVIPNVYPTLNGITGPFDLFQPSKIEQTTLDSVGFSPAIPFTGGTDYMFTLNSSYTTVDSLDGTSLEIGSYTFVLTKTPSSNNEYGGYITDDRIVQPGSIIYEIDLNSCNSVQDVLAAIKSKDSTNIGYGIDSNGAYYLSSPLAMIKGKSFTGYLATVEAASPTGLFSSPSNFTGGKNPSGLDDNDPDSLAHQFGKQATFSLNGLVANTGITIDRWADRYMLRFVTGNSAPTPSIPSNGVISVGVDYSGTVSYGPFSLDMSNRQLKLTVNEAGEGGNDYRVTDGIVGKTYEFLSTTALSGTSSRNDAYATVDVSGYTNVEDLISDLKGKAIMYPLTWSSREESKFENPIKQLYNNYYEFIDSGSSEPLSSLYKISGSTVIDLADMRTAVANGKSIGEAFADTFIEKTKNNHTSQIKKATDSSGQTIGISFKALWEGAGGNNGRLFLAEGQLRSYTLDYGKWFTENPTLSIPDFLNNKGFRAYCASCDNQVFNFHFITDDLPEGPRPEADPTGEDIKHIYINVSNVTDASSLVQAIVEQATPELTGSDPDLNHFMRLVADDDKLIIYDERRLTDEYLRYAKDRSGNLLYEYQWDDTYNVGGAKIADGVWDNVEIGERKIYAKDLIIHHTDRASMNIHLKIPQTTLDHLFGYEAGSQDWTDFNVMTSKSREELLGNWAGTTRSGKHITKDEEGLLDKALNYLIGANCLVGAQNMRLKMTEENIVSQREGTVASESTIRDANMAKEMTDYTKANVLAQASQSMLAQANQNSSGVLKLLQ